LGSVESFHIKLHKKLICKWKEGLGKVYWLRDHIGDHEYKTVVLSTSRVFRGQRIKNSPDVNYLSSNLLGCCRHLRKGFWRILQIYKTKQTKCTRTKKISMKSTNQDLGRTFIGMCVSVSVYQRERGRGTGRESGTGKERERGC
jgi:hypothetical protein